MPRALQILFLLLFFEQFAFEVSYQKNDFRVMTFNIWNSGANVENGLQKIAKHIMIVNPDVVALQEVEANVTEKLKTMLGDDWEAVEHPNADYPDVALFTRHVIVPNTQYNTSVGIGTKIMLRNGYMIHFWCVHLNYQSYGPYAANNKMVSRLDQIMAGEYYGRVPQIKEVTEHKIAKMWMAKSSDVPLFIVGDFNSPSNLDWTEETRESHGDWAVKWPAAEVMEKCGFTDSYREIHPNVVEEPGITWSTVNKFQSEWNYTIPEPQDRVDFIFYKGPVVPFESVIYSGDEELRRIPYHSHNDYPSDHFAVYTDFTIM